MATGRRRGRAIIYIALILILLLVLVFALLRLYPLGGATATPPPGDGVTAVATPTEVQEVENLVVTTQDVRRGQTLTDDLLAVVTVPREQYTEGVFYNDKAQVAGSRARFDLKAHTPVTSALIVEPGSSGSILSFEVPVGKVAISVPVSKLSSISYGLQKGDRVNVIASLLLIDLDTNFQSRTPNRTGVVLAPGPLTGEDQSTISGMFISPPAYEVAPGDAWSYYGRVEIDAATGSPVYLLPNEPQRPRLVSQTLIQDVTILQIGTYQEPTPATQAQVVGTPSTEPAAPPAQDPSQQQAPVGVTPDVVTLVVDPQDAVSLNYLMLTGASLNLVLRSAGDDTRVDTEAATLQFILDQYRIPNPARLPYGTEPRMDQFPQNIEAFPEPSPRATPTPGG